MRNKNTLTAIKIALTVGTLLNLINSWDVILLNNWDFKLIAKILMTYAVPFCVSLYSSGKALKEINS
ncbi:MAG: nitrate/nitrite transporter NrtS [bacterium]|nr:nitrate/nitrite transporter NrtS [bacterium]